MFVAYRQFASAVGAKELKEVHVRLPAASEIAPDGTTVFPATHWYKNELLVLEKYFADVGGDIWSRGNGSTLKKLSRAKRVGLVIGDKKRNFLVHRIMASTFLSGFRHAGQTEVDHIDNTQNGALANLRWCTKRQNAFNKCPTRLKVHRKRVCERSSKPVQQLCPQTGDVIAEFPSGRAAAAALDIFQANISKAIMGQLRTTGGFAWQFSPRTTTLEHFKSRGPEVVGGTLAEAPHLYFSADLKVYNNKTGKMYVIPIAHGHVYPSIYFGGSLRYIHVVVAALRKGYTSMGEFDAHLAANNLVVMHNGDADKSNWWNCKLGTRSENAFDAVRNGCNAGKSAPRSVEIRLSASATSEIWRYDSVREAKFASYREAARALAVYSDLKNLASSIGTSARTGGSFSLLNSQKAWAFSV